MSMAMPEMPQPCDEWHALHRAACAAGGCAADQLLQRCAPGSLGRGGHVHVRIEPVDSPVAVWLQHQGHAIRSGHGSGMVVCLRRSRHNTVPHPAAEPGEPGEAASLMVSYAYAVAYRTVLAEQAGVATELHPLPSRVPDPSRALRAGRSGRPAARARQHSARVEHPAEA